MKIDKIDVQTLDSKHATDIAMVVDKLEFIQDINKLRTKWKITKLYKPSSFNIFLESNVMTNNGAVTDDVEIQKRLIDFKKDIEEVLNKFSRGKNFMKVVEYALATGVIPDGIYRSCYFDVVTIGEPDNLETPERYKHVIVLSPRTELKEVKEAYYEFEKHIKGKREFESRKSLTKTALSETEIEEGNKLITLITKQHEACMENLQKNNNVADVEREYLKFIKNTKPLRDKLNLLISKNPLDSDVPSDVDLIEEFHKGIIYPDEFNTLEKIHRARDWYWICYEDYLNGNSKEILPYPEVLTIWNQKCPYYIDPLKRRNYQDYEKERAMPKDHKCKYCEVNKVNTIEKAIPIYVKLLKQS